MRQQTSLSRRSFLRGYINKTPPARPPWSISEDKFIDQCIRCNDCVSACPTGLLKKGNGGFPEAVFSKSICHFCGDCESVCKNGAIADTGQKAWQFTPEINDQCLAMHHIHCRTCADMCDVEAIMFQLRPEGIALPVLQPDLCTSCGECTSTCPVDAIALKQP